LAGEYCDECEEENARYRQRNPDPIYSEQDQEEEQDAES
jgi:hypothetical protein